MTKVTLALGSFVVGVCASLSVSSFVHTSTRVHAQQAIVIEGAEPVVPPLRYFGHGDTLLARVQALDGISCEGCTIAVSAFTYAGGSYNLKNCSVPRNVPIILKGSAKLTLDLLQAMGAVPKPPSPPNPNNPPQASPKPQLASLEIRPQDNFTLVSTDK
jgi:hypothetical protein